MNISRHSPAVLHRYGIIFKDIKLLELGWLGQV